MPDRYRKLFLCSLVIFLVPIVLGCIPKGGMVVSFIVYPVLMMGLYSIFLGLTQGNDVEIGSLFYGVKYFGKAIWLYVLVSFFSFLWTLLLVIPGFVKLLSYSMAWYILIDNPQMTAREALNESKEIMNGHKWELFVLEMSFIPWLLLVVCTLGIASVYVTPYVNVSIANFYNNIKRQPQAEKDSAII